MKSHPLFFQWVNLLIRKLGWPGFYYSAQPAIAQTFEVELTCCNFLCGESVFLPALCTLVAWQCNELKKNKKKQGNKSFVQHTTTPTLPAAFNITATEFDPVVRPSAAKHFHITQGDIFISWLLFFFPSTQFYVIFFPLPNLHLLSSSGRSQVLSSLGRVVADGAGQ